MDGQEEWKHSRGLQHDAAHARHGAEAVRGVLDGQGLILGGRERLLLSGATRWRQTTSAEFDGAEHDLHFL